MRARKHVLKIFSAIFLFTATLTLFSCNEKGPASSGGDDEDKPGIEDIVETSEKETIEANILEFFDITLTLPTATLTSQVVNEGNKEAYKITLANANKTCYEFYEELSEALSDKGWSQSDGCLKKTVDNSTTFIYFEAEDADSTSFEMCIYISEANEDGSISYSYSTTELTKTEYIMGEALDLTGFSIVRTGSDGTVVTLTKDTDYSIDTSAFTTSLADGVDRLDINLTYELIGSTDLSGSISITILRPELIEFKGITLTGLNKTYDGNAYKVGVTLPSNATDYQVRYAVSTDSGETWGEWLNSNPEMTNVGSYTIKAEFSKTGYETMLVRASLNINEATFSNAEALSNLYSDITIDYTGNASQTAPVLEEGLSIPVGATVSFSSISGENWSTTTLTYTNAGTYRVYYKIEKANYQNVLGSYLVTINKATFDITTPYSDEAELTDGSIHFLQGEEIFYIFDSSTYTISVSDLGTVENLQTGDVVKYSIDYNPIASDNSNATWSNTIPAFTSNTSFSIKVLRGDNAESSIISFYVNYFANTTVTYDSLSLSISTVDPFSGENYSVTADSGLLPFSPYISTTAGDTTDIILARYRIKDGTWGNGDYNLIKLSLKQVNTNSNISISEVV